MAQDLKRKIVQLARVGDQLWYALADDGTVWHRPAQSAAWQRAEGFDLPDKLPGKPEPA